MAQGSSHSMGSRIFAPRSIIPACSWSYINILIVSNLFVSSMDYIMSFRYPPYNVRLDMARGGHADLFLFAVIEQEKKRKMFTTFMFPSLPARTAAGGNAAPKRWGAWPIASVFAVFSVALIVGQSRLVKAWVYFCVGGKLVRPTVSWSSEDSTYARTVLSSYCSSFSVNWNHYFVWLQPRRISCLSKPTYNICEIRQCDQNFDNVVTNRRTCSGISSNRSFTGHALSRWTETQEMHNRCDIISKRASVFRHCRHCKPLCIMFQSSKQKRHRIYCVSTARDSGDALRCMVGAHRSYQPWQSLMGRASGIHITAVELFVSYSPTNLSLFPIQWPRPLSLTDWEFHSALILVFNQKKSETMVTRAICWYLYLPGTLSTARLLSGHNIVVNRKRILRHGYRFYLNATSVQAYPPALRLW